MNPLAVILLVVLILLLVGALPAVGLHSYGYTPAGVLVVILIIVLVLALLGRL